MVIWTQTLAGTVSDGGASSCWRMVQTLARIFLEECTKQEVRYSYSHLPQVIVTL